VEVVDDTTLRYVLRPAKFHNGRDVGADDVRQTVEWVQDPANGSARASVYEGVEVEVEDDRTILLRLPQPDAGFRHNLPRLPIVPIEEVGSQAEAPIGCGPFIFREWVRGSHIDYDMNPDYWNSEAPRLDTLRIRTFADTQAAASSFLAGELDFVEGIPVGLATEFDARAQAGDIDTGTIFPGWVFIAFQNEREPFNNTAFKRAISLALDRSAIATAFGGPLGAQPLSVGPLAPNHAWFPADLTIERNLDEARRLMADAGFADGYTGQQLVLRIEQWAGSPDAGVVVQANLAEIGIDIQLEVTDSATYVDRRESGDFDMYLSGWFMAPDPAFVLDSLFITDASSNSWRYSNEEVDELLTEARTILDDDERRRELYHRAIEIVFVEEPAMLAMCTEPNLFAHVTTTNGDQYRPDPGPLFHYPIASTST
jgi:peptide/nickel transport system substrate-binding protein